MLVANGVTSVTEGANMPTTLEATKYLQENRYSSYVVKLPMQVVLLHQHLR